MSRKGAWGHSATVVNPRLSLGIFILISIVTIYFGSALAQPEEAESTDSVSPQAEFDSQLSAECQSPLYQELSTISVHTDDPRLVEHADLMTRCNDQLNRVVSRSATRMMNRTIKMTMTITKANGKAIIKSPHPIVLSNRQNCLSRNCKMVLSMKRR